jgi:hypothetical protein
MHNEVLMQPTRLAVNPALSLFVASRAAELILLRAPGHTR